MQRLNQYLVVDSSQPENAYGRFTEEILRSEGFMGFSTVDLAGEPFPELAPEDVVLVTRCFMRRAQLERMLQAVNDGACVVFLQPQQCLVELLGFTASCSVTYPGYVKVREGYPANGLPLQTHLPIPCHGLPDDREWEVLADNLDAEWCETGYPAVVKTKLGRGAIALFFYDLPEAVARIRFGNPDLGCYNTNVNWDWPHALDLFLNHVDERLAHLPQADLHGQLLARVLVDIAPYPLARLWYYEEAEHRTAAVFQSDGDMSTPEEFHTLAAALEERGGTGTFYLMENTRLSEGDVASLRGRGHTFGPHVDPRKRDEELYFAMPDALKEETALFRKRFGTVSRTLQCHCAPWPGYMSMVPAHIEEGYRMLFAYMTSPFGLWGKYLCGSGRPIKFCGRDGTRYDCRQQPLVFFDDASLTEFLRDSADTAKKVIDATVDAALATTHTVTPVLSHPVSFCTYSSPVMEYCFDRLRDAGAPIYNGDAWLDFVERREAVRVLQERDKEGYVICTVTGLDGRIPVMFPAKYRSSDASRLSVNGKMEPGCRQRRFDEDWQFIQLDSEKHGTEVRIALDGQESTSPPGHRKTSHR